MRRHDIRALAGRRFRPRTTDSRHSLPVAPNLLAQRFVTHAVSGLAGRYHLHRDQRWLAISTGHR